RTGQEGGPPDKTRLPILGTTSHRYPDEPDARDSSWSRRCRGGEGHVRSPSTRECTRLVARIKEQECGIDWTRRQRAGRKQSQRAAAPAGGACTVSIPALKPTSR